MAKHIYWDVGEGFGVVDEVILKKDGIEFARYCNITRLAVIEEHATDEDYVVCESNFGPMPMDVPTWKKLQRWVPDGN